RHAADEQAGEQQQRAGVEVPVGQLQQAAGDHAEADQDVRGGRPVDLAAGDEELLVDRLEQIKVEVAGADEVGEGVAVFEEERLDAAFEGVVAAEEDEELRLRPALDV